MTDGWVPVHAATEHRSEEAMLVYNRLVDLVEEIFPGAPNGKDIDGPGYDDAVEWWESHPDIADLVRKAADDIAAEYEADPRLVWWIANNRDVEAQEGGDPDVAEVRTRRAFADHPDRFEIPED